MKHWKSLFSAFLLTAATVLPAAGRPGAAVQDQANILSPATVAQIERLDDEINRATGQDLLVVTEPTLSGTLQEEANAIFRREGLKGMLILVVPDSKKLGLVPGRSAQTLFPSARLQQIRQSMLPDFRRGDYNAGIVSGATQVRDTFVQAPAGALAPTREEGSSSWSSWLWIGLALLAGFFLIRWIASMFLGNPRGNYPGSSTGYPGGYPGGYQGGGFWSGLAGGIGGALLGNTLYDTFTNRHGHDAGGFTDSGGPPTDAGAGVGDFSDWGDSSAGAGDFGDGGSDWG